MDVTRVRLGCWRQLSPGWPAYPRMERIRGDHRVPRHRRGGVRTVACAVERRRLRPGPLPRAAVSAASPYAGRRWLQPSWVHLHDRGTENMKPFMADLARVVDARVHGCSLQFLKDGRIADARWSQGILRRGIVVRPCHFVVVTTREAEPKAFEVVWRGAAVATVTSVDGNRLTYDTGYPPDRGVTRTFHDLRPDDERGAIQP